MPQIQVSEAQIHTAAVQIKTLTINGKQMTLAVFRQLRSENLIDPEGNFKGLPWGTVNYHPKCGLREEDHFHLIWQLGGELKRAVVQRPIRIPLTFGQDNRWMRFAAALGFQPAKEAYKQGFSGGTILTVSVEGRHVCFSVPRDVLDVWEARSEFQAQECAWARRRLEDVLQTFRGSFDMSDEALTEARDVAHQEMLEQIYEDENRSDRFQARWEELTDLPQLFIAV